MSYQEKYLKYKNKYLKLKQQIGGKQLTLYDLNDRTKNTKYFINFEEGDALYQIEMQLRAQLTKNKIDFDDTIYYLLQYSKDKELIKKTLLQNNIDYKLINNIILDNFSDISLIPDNYQSMLQEIRRIKEIMK